MSSDRDLTRFLLLPPPQKSLLLTVSGGRGGAAMDGTSSSPSLPFMTPYCSERKPKLCTSPLPCCPLSLSVSQAGLMPCFLLFPPHGFGVLAQNIWDIPPWGFALQLPLPRSLPASGRGFPPGSEALC